MPHYAQKKLQSEIESSLRTVMIGILSIAEELLDGPENPENSDEAEWCDRFDDFRKRLLDYGNSKIRNVHKILNKYTVTGKYYNYEFRQPKEGQ